jgi:hypothetical protein
MKNHNISTMKASCLIIVACVLIFSGTAIVLGVQGAGIFPGKSSGLNYSYSGSGTAYSTEPGNLTFFQVDAYGGSINTHWAGFYGNVSGNLTLEDANGNVFYDWTGLGIAIGEIYASNVSIVLWDSINCTNSSQIDAINSFLNVTGADTDSVGYTYSENIHPSFSVGGRAFLANTCNTTNTYSNGAKDASLFSQILLADSQDCPVFTTLINASSASFEGSPVDFQLLAGVKKSSLTDLYFFIELG